MKVLGISDHIISGAAVVENGRVVCAVNEERLARKKMLMGFPRLSIAHVLELAGVRPEELDHVAVASDWGHFLDDPVEFNSGVFAVDEGLVKNVFFAVGSRISFLRSKLPFLEKLRATTFVFRINHLWSRRRLQNCRRHLDFRSCMRSLLRGDIAHDFCCFISSHFFFLARRHFDTKSHRFLNTLNMVGGAVMCTNVQEVPTASPRLPKPPPTIC